MAPTAVLVPIKGFDDAKARLAERLEPRARVDLARKLAAGVLSACSDLDVHVVSEDDDVAAWAHERGANVIKNPVAGLNNAVRHGVATLAAAGVARVLVTHADLAVPKRLPDLVAIEGLVLAPDDALDGTNALVIPTKAGFTFSYGPGSFARHLSEAERVGEPITIVRDLGLGLDVDEADDLDSYESLRSDP